MALLALANGLVAGSASGLPEDGAVWGRGSTSASAASHSSESAPASPRRNAVPRDLSILPAAARGEPLESGPDTGKVSDWGMLLRRASARLKEARVAHGAALVAYGQMLQRGYPMGRRRIELRDHRDTTALDLMRAEVELPEVIGRARQAGVARSVLRLYAPSDRP